MMPEVIEKGTAFEVLKEFLGKNKGEKVLVEYKVKALLKELGLPIPKGIVMPRDQAAGMPDLSALTYPLVAKISSSKIVSKSDIGGVKVGLRNKDELREAVIELLRFENAEGVYVEEMAPSGLEVIVGGMVDEQFGPVVMLGLGGLLVEFFRDVLFALAPLTMEEALSFIKRFKASKLFEGYRGRPALDLDIVLQIIVVVSELMASCLIAEIDLNPVALYPQGAMILDAKMQLKKTKGIASLEYRGTCPDGAKFLDGR
jgi:succinyl-CoA synthetase beta subunit